MANTTPIEDWEKLPSVPAIPEGPAFTALAPFEKKITAETIREALLEDYNGVQGYVIVKRWSELFAEAVKLMLPDALKSQQGKKMEIELGGRVVAETSEKGLAKEWLYKDETLDRLEAQLETLKEDIKARKTKLQKAKEGVPDGNGEIVTPAQLINAGITIAVAFR